MTETASQTHEEQAPDEQAPDELYNTLRRGAFVETTERGHVFALEDHTSEQGEPIHAIVELEEFDHEPAPEAGQTREMLVERPRQGRLARQRPEGPEAGAVRRARRAG